MTGTLMWILMRVPRPRGSPSVSSLTAKLPSALLSHSHCLSSLCLLTTCTHPKQHLYSHPHAICFLCLRSSQEPFLRLHLIQGEPAPDSRSLLQPSLKHASGV